MNENEGSLQSRFYLETAKFYYEEMKTNLQEKTKFLRSLLAFLPIARSVTLVFQKEFHCNKQLMDWYDSKVKEWEGNSIMKCFRELRNISLKERPPRMQAIESIVDSVIEATVRVYRKPPTVEIEEIRGKQTRTVGYSSDEYSRLYPGHPEVMSLCKTYLDELENFVSEAENMVREEGVES